MENYRMTPDVMEIPGMKASAAFITPSNTVFREHGDIVPVSICEGVEIMPWGVDNNMPFDIMDHVERDETMTTCMQFNAEVCYGAGLEYDVQNAQPGVKRAIEEFKASNSFPSYFMGVCQDFKYFGFAVSVIILSRNKSKILSIRRKEACYCRFAPVGPSGRIEKVYYANWRNTPLLPENIETIDVLDPSDPFGDLALRLANKKAPCKYAVVSRIPVIDSTYYPIPHYASLFRGKWYDIKQLIGVAKEAKLRNSAPLKYQIEIADGYWDRLFRELGITDPEKQRECVNARKRMFIDYLTGAENSGKVLFSTYATTPDGRTIKDVVITKLDVATQGGDWATDIQEAVNMICFTLRVHSNLLGSVPGKSQMNNSGSDKRELFTISQAVQKPYRDILLDVHRLIIRFNKWTGVRPYCPFLTLTTLDEHTDAKEVEITEPETETE